MVVAVAALATIGLLFAVDPGGAITESGFPNFREMDWKQLAVWGFRAVGAVLAQLIVIALWLWPKWRPPQAVPWRSGTTLPSSMPAAAVSVLGGHMIGSSTILASITEMRQRGALRIEAVNTRVGFLYRLSRQGPTQYDWERTICDSLPSGPTTTDALHEAIQEREDAIGDQIGDYLQHRGLFDDNPVRIRRENDDDAVGWGMLVGLLMGVGSGLWAALWLDQWWANALIGGFAGLVYLGVAPTIRTGMLKPTQAGAIEIGRWLGWRESLAGDDAPGARYRDDSMLAYAAGFDVAQPWLDVSAQAPPWFVSGEASDLRGADLDVAYHAFMHAPEWYLTGRSDDASKAAAQPGHEEELRLLEQLDSESPDSEPPPRAGRSGSTEEVRNVVSEVGTRRDSPAAPVAPSAARYQTHRLEGAAEKKKGCGRLFGCLMWALGLAVIGVATLIVLFSLDVVSPRDKPCPMESPPIPTPAQIAVAGDLFRDGCVRVRGALVARDSNGLTLEVERGEYTQRVTVRDPSEVLEAIPVGRVVTLAGWLKVEEEGTYAVHFVPKRGSDREWWRNLRENLEALF